MNVPNLSRLFFIVTILSLKVYYVLTQTENVCGKTSNSVFYRGRCLAYVNKPLSWFDAMSYCEHHIAGGRLAELVTPDERQAAYDLMKKFDQNGKKTEAWVAISDLEVNRQYKWYYSNKLNDDTSSWSDGEPNNYNNNEHCGLFYQTTMNDYICADSRNFLCETEMNDLEPLTNPCYPLGDVATYVNGKCLLFVDTPMNLSNAQFYCASFGARLSEFLTDEEKNQLTNFLVNETTNKVWIGGAKNATGSTYVWLHGGQEILVNMWTSGYPSKTTADKCVYLTSNHLFSNANCDSKKKYICENATCSNQDKSCLSLLEVEKTWSEAKKACADYNLRLAELDTTFKINAVKENLPDAWIGAMNYSGVYRWTESQTPVRLNWWDSSKTTMECVLIDAKSGLLSKQACSQEYTYVCEMEKEDPCKSVNGGWYHDGNCYLLVRTKATASRAKEQCLLNNSHLAEPNTHSLQNFVGYKIFAENYDIDTVWLGAQKESLTFNWYTTGLLVNASIIQSSDANKKNLIWKNTATGLVMEASLSTESHFFVCQTASTNSKFREYLVVLPPTSRDISTITHTLEVSANYASVTVYVKIDFYNLDVYTLSPVASLSVPLESMTNLPQSLGVKQRYLKVTSSQPVTVVLNMIDTDGNSGSSLILPVHMFVTNTSTFYSLDTGLTQLTDRCMSVVAMSSLYNDITITLTDVMEKDDDFTIANSTIRSQKNIYSALRSAYEDLEIYATVYPGFNFLTGKQPMALFLSDMAAKKVNCDGYIESNDFAFDQVIPMEYIGYWYMGFPSRVSISTASSSGNTNITKQYESIYTVVSPYDNVFINIYATSIKKSHVIPKARKVQSIPCEQGSYCYFQGSPQFYLAVHHKVIVTNSNDSSTLEKTCMSAILPESLWKYQYDYHHLSSAYTAFIHLIVNTSLITLIEINGKSVTLSCNTDTSISWSGCSYTVPLDIKTYHIQLKYHQSTFGAYLYSESDLSITCYPLGITDDLSQKFSGPVTYTTDDLYGTGREVTPPITCQAQPSTPVDTSISASKISTQAVTTACNVTTQLSAQTTTTSVFSASLARSTDTTATRNSITSPSVTNLISSASGFPESSTSLPQTSTSQGSPTTVTAYPSQGTSTMTDHVDSSNAVTSEATLTTQEKTTSVLQNEQLVQEMKTAIIKALSVEKVNVLSFKMTKECLKDSRPSSTAIGYLGIIILSTVFTFLCISDVIALAYYSIQWLKKTQFLHRWLKL